MSRFFSHGITELSSPAIASLMGHGPSLDRRVHRPQRSSIASPAIAFTPDIFSQASRSSAKIRVPGSRYGTPLSLGMSYLSLIHISEPTRQAEISYAVFCLKKKK